MKVYIIEEPNDYGYENELHGVYSTKEGALATILAMPCASLANDEIDETDPDNTVAACFVDGEWYRVLEFDVQHFKQ